MDIDIISIYIYYNSLRLRIEKDWCGSRCSPSPRPCLTHEPERRMSSPHIDIDAPCWLYCVARLLFQRFGLEDLEPK